MGEAIARAARRLLGRRRGIRFEVEQEWLARHPVG